MKVLTRRSALHAAYGAYEPVRYEHPEGPPFRREGSAVLVDRSDDAGYQRRDAGFFKTRSRCSWKGRDGLTGLEAAPDKMLEIVWKKPNRSLLWAPISSANGVCFIPDNTTMRVLNCKTGDELAAFDVPGTVGSAAAISEGRVFFGAGFAFSLGPVMPGRSLVALGLP